MPALEGPPEHLLIALLGLLAAYLPPANPSHASYAAALSVDLPPDGHTKADGPFKTELGKAAHRIGHWSDLGVCWLCRRADAIAEAFARSGRMPVAPANLSCRSGTDVFENSQSLTPTLCPHRAGVRGLWGPRGFASSKHCRAVRRGGMSRSKLKTKATPRLASGSGNCSAVLLR